MTYVWTWLFSCFMSLFRCLFRRSMFIFYWCSRWCFLVVFWVVVIVLFVDFCDRVFRFVGLSRALIFDLWVVRCYVSWFSVCVGVCPIVCWSVECLLRFVVDFVLGCTLVDCCWVWSWGCVGVSLIVSTRLLLFRLFFSLSFDCLLCCCCRVFAFYFILLGFSYCSLIGAFFVLVFCWANVGWFVDWFPIWC